MLDPSVETKTSVLWWEDPEKPSAISSRAAVAAALVGGPASLRDVTGRDQGDLAIGLPGEGGDQIAQVDVVPVERAARSAARRRSPRRSPRTAASPARPSRCRRPSPASDRRPSSASCFASGAAVVESNASGGTPPESGGGADCNENIAITARKRDREQRESVETQIDHSGDHSVPSNLQAWREDRRGSCSWTTSKPCRRFSPTRSARKVMRWWGPWMGKRPWIASARRGSISWCSTSCSRSWMGSRSAAACAPAARCRSSC